MNELTPWAHVIVTAFRWVLSYVIIWHLVLPETGVWTALFLTLLTIGFEVICFKPDVWRKL